MVVKRFDIYFVELNPTVGIEINKTRPCLVVSPTDLNRALNTVIIAPLTSNLRNYPSRIDCLVGGKNGQIALDQIRTVDKARLRKKIGVLEENTCHLVLSRLLDMFS